MRESGSQLTKRSAIRRNFRKYNNLPLYRPRLTVGPLCHEQVSALTVGMALSIDRKRRRADAVMSPWIHTLHRRGIKAMSPCVNCHMQSPTFSRQRLGCDAVYSGTCFGGTCCFHAHGSSSTLKMEAVRSS
jgi:hypothetical protein